MLRWALMFFVISLVEGVLGLRDATAGSEPIARLFFVLALGVMVMFHRAQTQLPTPPHGSPDVNHKTSNTSISG